MSSVYVCVNFRFTKTVSVNVKQFRDDSLKTPSFIAQPCLFIPLQDKCSVTGIRSIGEILFTKVSLIRTPNSRYQKLDGTAFATCISSCNDAILGSLAMLVVVKE